MHVEFNLSSIFYLPLIIIRKAHLFLQIDKAIIQEQKCNKNNKSSTKAVHNTLTI